MTNVVELTIPPKKINRRYKNHAIVITYKPPTKKWSWEVTYVQTTKFSDEADTMTKAVKAAEKHIDSTLKIRGQA